MSDQSGGGVTRRRAERETPHLAAALERGAIPRDEAVMRELSRDADAANGLRGLLRERLELCGGSVRVSAQGEVAAGHGGAQPATSD